MEGEKPNSVTAITAQQQPENNPEVDDEAIILLKYDKLVAIIQASWNWPIGRKDMEIYGKWSYRRVNIFPPTTIDLNG